jgi:hypothetical protein
VADRARCRGHRAVGQAPPAAAGARPIDSPAAWLR